MVGVSVIEELRWRDVQSRKNSLTRHGKGNTLGVLSEFPRLRSGFRLRAQTPAMRLNFDLPLGTTRHWDVVARRLAMPSGVPGYFHSPLTRLGAPLFHRGLMGATACAPQQQKHSSQARRLPSKNKSERIRRKPRSRQFMTACLVRTTTSRELSVPPGLDKFQTYCKP
jgi:hypothetical protein